MDLYCNSSFIAFDSRKGFRTDIATTSCAVLFVKLFSHPILTSLLTLPVL